MAKIPARKSAPSGRRKRAASTARRTNVYLDMELVEQAKNKLKVRTTREAIHGALQALMKPVDYSELLAAYGSGGIVADYDPKALYGNRAPAG